MKYLILFILLFSGCSDAIPKYKKTQKVLYKNQPFYDLVCSGKGVVEGFDCNGSCVYRIKTPDEEPECPSYFYIKEKDLQAVK